MIEVARRHADAIRAAHHAHSTVLVNDREQGCQPEWLVRSVWLARGLQLCSELDDRHLNIIGEFACRGRAKDRVPVP